MTIGDNWERRHDPDKSVYGDAVPKQCDASTSKVVHEAGTQVSGPPRSWEWQPINQTITAPRTTARALRAASVLAIFVSCGTCAAVSLLARSVLSLKSRVLSPGSRSSSENPACASAER